MVSGLDDAQGVAVGRRLRAFRAADHHVGAGPVLHDHRLPHPVGQLLRHQARRHVGHRPGRDRHDHPDRPARIGLRHGGQHAQTENCERDMPRTFILPAINVPPAASRRSLRCDARSSQRYEPASIRHDVALVLVEGLALEGGGGARIGCGRVGMASSDKTTLLHALVIDRAAAKAPATRRRRAWRIAAIYGALASVAVFGVVWLLLSRTPMVDGAERAIAQAGPGAAAAQPASVASDSPKGGLAASGYVVARRKATVAAGDYRQGGRGADRGRYDGERRPGGGQARQRARRARPRARPVARAGGRGGGPGDRGRSAGCRAHPRAHAQPVAEEFRQRGRPHQGRSARQRAARPAQAGAGRARDRHASTPSAPPRCSTSTASARRSPASWSTAAPSPAR